MIAATATVGIVGVAGAAADEEVYSKESGGPCFSLTASGACQPSERPAVAVETGDTVTWNFAGNAQPHNVSIAEDVDAAEPDWLYQGPLILPSDEADSDSFTFGEAGEYEFICEVHATTMRGTITVTGEPVETPTATATVTATPTASPTATPDPQPGGGTDDDHTQTPAPDGVQDAVDPQLGGVRAKARRRAVRVRFRLSEPASVSITVKRRGGPRRNRIYRRLNVQAPAGTSTVKLRGKRVKRGRYVVQLRARDAAGNRSSLARESFRVRRR